MPGTSNGNKKKLPFWPFGNAKEAGNFVAKVRRPAVPEDLFTRDLSFEVLTTDDINEKDIIIVLMGPTRTGKSTFVETAAGAEGIGWAGGDFFLFTTDIRAVRIAVTSSVSVVLVDTPGFDGTLRSDLDILELISNWLKHTYKRGLRVSGILYLHCISDNRIGGTPLKILEMFKKMCGKDMYKKVIFLTTMWEDVDLETGIAREEELRTVYWAELVKGGSRVLRFERTTRAEAWDIINLIITMELGMEPMQIQEELVGLKKFLQDTQAGQVLTASAMEQLIEQQEMAFQRLREEMSKASDPIIIAELKNELMQLRSKRDDVTNQLRLAQPRGILNFQQLKLPRLRAEPKRSRLTTQQFRSLVSDIMRDHNCKKLVCKLERDDAQHVVDYFNLVLQEAGNLASDEKERILSLLCNLAKSAMVYPQYYLLKDVTRDAHPIAGGGFADVYKGKHEKHTISLKVVRVFQSHDNRQLMRAHLKEVILWPQLSHPNILPFYGVYLLDEPLQRISLVSPWMENGNMSTYLKEHPETPWVPLLIDIVSGLIYLHQSSVVHGDLKAANILISDYGRALITDFGLSYVAIGSGWTSSLNGTMRWTAPELLANDSIAVPPTREGDIWSFGCLCYEVLAGKIPFHEYSDKKVLALLSGGSEPSVRTLPGEKSDVRNDEMWDLMKNCWNFEPQIRPSCETIRGLLVGLCDQDDRGEFSTHIWDTAAKFREAMRKESGAKMDYRRVEEILLRVQKERHNATVGPSQW